VAASEAAGRGFESRRARALSSKGSHRLTQDLLSNSFLPRAAVERIAQDAAVLPQFAAAQAATLLAALQPIIAAAPLRHMITPGGQRMSVAMTNCGRVGWVTDRRGYRYDPADPDSGLPWPAMPKAMRLLATRAASAAGFDGFYPDACLINRYEPNTRLTAHQDRNERDFAAPVVSVSLGLPALFLFGGPQRRDPSVRIALSHGDVVVWGGQQRLAFHGVARLCDGEHPLTGRCRINLTFRKAL
jgi:alkylated DNA repair protein (DNA oxidative demethylase)